MGAEGCVRRRGCGGAPPRPAARGRGPRQPLPRGAARRRPADVRRRARATSRARRSGRRGHARRSAPTPAARATTRCLPPAAPPPPRGPRRGGRSPRSRRPRVASWAVRGRAAPWRAIRACAGRRWRHRVSRAAAPPVRGPRWAAARRSARPPGSPRARSSRPSPARRARGAAARARGRRRERGRRGRRGSGTRGRGGASRRLHRGSAWARGCHRPASGGTATLLASRFEGPRCQCVNTRDLTPRCRAQTTSHTRDLPERADVDATDDAPDVAPPCAAGLTRCGGACVDLMSSAAHCSHCGMVCPGVCVGGRCEGFVCPPGTTRCSGVCVDPRSDADHCGACGRRCPGGCVAGACAVPAGVSVGASHSCVRYSDGRVFCWGTTGLGVLTAPLASGSSAHRPRPVLAVGPTGTPVVVQQLVSSGAANCGIESTGAVTCWGEFGAFGGRPGIAPASRTRATSRSTPGTTSARRRPTVRCDAGRRPARRPSSPGSRTSPASPWASASAARSGPIGRSGAGARTRPASSATGPGPCAPPPSR